MTYIKQTKYGEIQFNDEVIASIAGGAAVECYGVVGMAPQKPFKDGIAELLKKENYSRGVVVTCENEMYNIDMYVILGFSVKIDEVAQEIQKLVAYQLEKTLNIKVNKVNVYVQGIRINL